MRVLIIGATKGIGLACVKTTLAAGHQVRAFARSADKLGLIHENLETMRGDAVRAADIDKALAGMDAVIQTLSVPNRDLFRPVRLFSVSTRILVPAMDRHGTRRLIAVTGFGAGDSQSAIRCPQRIGFRLFLGRAYDDKNVQEQIIKDSGLDWTIVRPGVLFSGPGSGRYKVLSQPRQWRNGIISRADVADFITKALSDPQHIRQAPVLVRV